MDIGEQLQDRGLTNDDLIKLFLKAQDDLVRLVERADAGSSFGAYRGQQARAIGRIVTRMQEQARRWTDKEIPKLVRAGDAEMKRFIKDLKEPKFALEFSGVNERAIRILAEDAFLEFGGTMEALKRNISRAIMNKRKLQEEIVSSVAQGSSVARTQKQLIDILKKDGVEVLKARNGFGRRFSLEHYTNMLVRTQSMTAYNLGARERLTGVGRRFALFPTIRPDIDGEDICNEWERKKYVDLTKDQIPPQSTHPNCRHVLRPVSFDQLKAERPDLYRLAVGYWKDTAEE